jgi:hypothetical protein
MTIEEQEERVWQIEELFSNVDPGDLPDGVDDIDPDDDAAIGVLVRKLTPRPGGASGVAVPLDE